MLSGKDSSSAQGTMEYLVILGVVISVALAAVSLVVTPITDDAGQVSAVQNKQYWTQQSIGLADALIDGNGDAVFILKNNTEYPLVLAAYSLGDDLRTLNQGISFNPGETKNVFFSEIGNCLTTGTNTCSYDKVVFHYTAGGSELYDSGGAALVTGRNPDVSRFNLTGSDDWICVENQDLRSCESPARVGPDTNWQTNWATFDTNMRATYNLPATPAGSVTDTNWQTSWTTFDTNMKTTYGLNPTSGYIPFGNGTKLSSDGNLYWDNTNKRLGIGTAAPGVKLEISRSNSSVIEWETIEDLMLRNPNGTDNTWSGIGFHSLTNIAAGIAAQYYDTASSYARLSFGVRGPAGWNSNVMTLTDGNVGIGTTTPLAPLQVSKSIADSFTGTEIGLLNLKGGTDTDDYSYLSFTSLNRTEPLGKIGIKSSGSGSYMHFGTSNNYALGVTNTAMTIDYTGNVGIGTTGPGNKLTVMGDSSWRFSGNNDQLIINNPSAGVVAIQAQDISAWKDIDLAFYTEKTTGGNQVAERMRITNQGNVGIGTSAPAAQLDVNGTSGLLFNVRNGSTSYLDVNATTGYVGIGTTAPTSLLHIEKNQVGRTSVLVKNTNNQPTDYSEFALANTYGTVGGIRLNPGGGGVTGFGAHVDTVIYNTYNSSLYGDIVFSTHNGTSQGVRMTIDTSGNVGIGTTSPQNKLNVIGDINAFNGNMYTDRNLYVTGSAGIGDFSGGYFPQANLQVEGTGLVISNRNSSGYGFWDYYTFDQNTDIQNGEVSALYVYPYQNSRRLYFGKTNKGFYALNFANVVQLESVPNIIYQKGNYFAWGDPNDKFWVQDRPTHLPSEDNVATLQVYDSTATSGTFALRGSSTGNIPFYVNLYNQRVGIGTTSPSELLDLNGLMRFRNGAVGAGAYYDGSGTEKWFWGTDGATDVMRLYSATKGGNVAYATGSTGIVAFSYGINTPSLRMTSVAPETAPAAYPDNNEAVSISYSNTLQMRFGGGNSGSYPGWIQMGNTSSTATYPLLLNPLGGNVGIGTASPQSKLDTNGRIIQRGAATNAVSTYLQTNGDAQASQTNLNPGILLWQSANDAYGIDLGYSSTSTGSYGVRAFFPSNREFAVASYPANTLPTSQSNFTYRMVVEGDGKVGIGTASPSAQLHIDAPNAYALEIDRGTNVFKIDGMYGGPGSGGPIAFLGNNNMRLTANNDSYPNQIYLKTDGNVGIGTASPSYALDVNGSTHSSTSVLVGSGSAGLTTSGATDILVKDGAGNTSFRGVRTNTGWADQVSTGYFQIGNSTDNVALTSQSGTKIARLQISSTATQIGGSYYNAIPAPLAADLFELIDGSNNVRMVVQNAGNVGIGTATPRQALDVVGKVTADYYIRGGDNIYVGRFIDGGTYLTLDAYNGSTWTDRNLRIQGNEIYFLDGATTEVMRLKNGNVGIGTTAPNAPLTVGALPNNYNYPIKMGIYSGSDAYNIVSISRSTTTNPQVLALGVNQASTYSEIQAIQDGVGYNNLVLQKSGGNVGIGTTAPVVTLDINAVARLVPTDSPGTCSASLTGSIQFDASLGKLCYCNGTSWCRVGNDSCGTSTSCG